MEHLFSTICDHAEWAPEILFLLLIIAGFNIPISEDILLITGGAITALCIPEHHLKMFIFIYLGAWMSSWVCYSIGYFLGPAIYNIRWFKRWINPESVDWVHQQIEKHKYLIFFVIRFIPGGVRNTFFMTCGLGKMPFKTFIFRDGLASLLSTAVIFHVGFEFASHYDEIIQTIHKYQYSFLLFWLFAIIAIALVLGFRKNKG